MIPGNDHLTIEEVLGVLHSYAGPTEGGVENKAEEHLRQCTACTRRVQQYRQFMAKLYGFDNPQHQGKCVDPSVWGELAGGLLSQQDATQHLKHAAACSACMEELLHALEALESNEGIPKVLEGSLTTATPEWQKEFAAKIASKYGRSQASPQTIPLPRHPRRFLSFSWGYAGIAALLVVSLGIGLYLWPRGGSAEALIREAYAQQRTVEMRIPGAGYGPIQVQRAAGNSEISSPRALLEAEVLIKRGLEQHSDDVELLRQKAEADLLNWNYQAALETLNHAARLRSSSFELLVDMATAYFERAEATSNPADYEAGLQSLGDAIHLKPDDPAALFNRAIMYEKLYFYGRAIADWEQFLKIEKDPGWRKEAEQRLKEIRERQQQQSKRHDPDRLTIPEFTDDAADAVAIDEYVQAAERRILPLISERRNRDEYYRAATDLALRLQFLHADSFLSDLLLSADQSSFHQPAYLLSESVRANHGGDFEKAFSYAGAAAVIFRKSGNVAGRLASEFQQAYALQFESRAGACRNLAATAVAESHRKNYFLLEAQLLLEQSICSNMTGDLGEAKELVQRALAVARDHDYKSAYLRGLTQLATLECDAGEESSAWSAIREGLGMFWSSDLPPVRAYSFYAALDRMAERLGHVNVQFAALYEALAFRAENSNPVVEAAAHAKLADAALRIGELQVAQTQFAEAERIFAAEPATDSVRWRELEARINLARVQSLQNGETQQTIAVLLAALPEVRQLSNRYLEFQYYDTLAELMLRAGDVSSASRFLENAIAIAQAGVRSLTSWRERLAWMEQHRQPFVLKTKLLLESGQEESALEQWERYRQAGVDPAVPAAARLLKISNIPAKSLSDQPSPEMWVITYAFAPRALMTWVRHGTEIHSASVPVSIRDLQRTVDSFINECARTDSDLAELQADGQSLYATLIQPVSRWLPESGHLAIEPDGMLGIVPFEALVDPSQSYLGKRYTVSMAPAPHRGDRPDATPAITAFDRALIVAVPAAEVGRQSPLPGTLEEARTVAGNFDHPEVLLGRAATVAEVERGLESSSVFHFAGHGTSGRNGAAVLLADGMLDSEHDSVLDAQRLNKLKLAMFSACGTARSSEVSEWNSLVTAFLQAGTQHVVASRWNVDSMATTEFVKLFYRSIFSGNSVEQSLQSAANAFRADPARARPYYWAAFSAFGKG